MKKFTLHEKETNNEVLVVLKTLISITGTDRESGTCIKWKDENNELCIVFVKETPKQIREIMDSSEYINED